MKRVFTILAAVLLTATLWAQSPEKMSYQAVIRDASDNLVTSQQIGMQISILQDSTGGTAVYVETQESTTNANGLVSLEIGTGTVQSGDFTTIDWANGPYFIKTETAVEAPLTTYTITGTSQLLSVPYALHAKTAETVTGGITETDPTFTSSQAANITATDITNWNNKQDQLTAGTNIIIDGNTISATGGGSSNDFYLGQDTLGGIVFYIYLDANGEQRGLIVSKTETTAQWQNSTSTTNATRSWDGAYNMDLMTNSPAKNWITTNFSTDWYLPSIDELSILWHNRFHANKGLNDASATLLSNADYWSSTESDVSNAVVFYFFNGYSSSNFKTFTYSVRAVRAF